MKNTLKIALASVFIFAVAACNNKNSDTENADSLAAAESVTTSTSAPAVQVVPGTYTDLSSGKPVYIVSDPETGWAMDSISKVPVEFYIDRTGDTLFRTGLVVNNAIMKSNGKWILDETKIKRDGDEIKIKYADGSKVKMDNDELKIKGEEGKIKVDDDTVKVKP